MTSMPDEHEEWSELAVGHALSSLDDADEAMYLEHAASCDTCRELEREFSETLADLALAAPTVAPPPSLKASIMAAIGDDDSRGAAVIPIDRHARFRRVASAEDPACGSGELLPPSWRSRWWRSLSSRRGTSKPPSRRGAPRSTAPPSP